MGVLFNKGVRVADGLALEVGARIDRQELHERFGGRVASRISPSSRSRNLFVFLDVAATRDPGLRDGWKSDGCYHFTGEGVVGDQLVKGGNLSLAAHIRDGSMLHLFKGVRGEVEYMGRFRADDELPYYRYDTAEIRGPGVRSVICFRLRPLDVAPRVTDKPGIYSQTEVRFIPFEGGVRDPDFKTVESDGSNAVRRNLVGKYVSWLDEKMVEYQTAEVICADECQPMFADLFLPETETLIAFRGSVTRASVRAAVGELEDLGQFIEPREMQVILPFEPRYSHLRFLASRGITAAWPAREGFNFSELSPAAKLLPR